MPDLVFDSSIIAKLVLPEADSAAAWRLLFETTADGSRIVALDIALIEVTNAIWTQLHRQKMAVPEAQQALDELLKLPIDVEPALPLTRAALEIGAKYDRAVYDSLFIALAIDMGLTGVTADVPLHRAVHSAIPQVMLLCDM